MLTSKSKISDVAELAGVSTATVSRVLNGGICSENTQKRVLKAVKSLNYNINLDGKALRSGKTKRIYLSLANISNPFYTTLAESIENFLTLIGYHILLSASANTEDSIHEQIVKAESGIADGFIFGPIDYTQETLQKLRKVKIPTVIFGPPVTGTKLDSVEASEYEGLKSAIVHMVAKGKKRFLLFNGPAESIPGKSRNSYFKKVFLHLKDQSLSFEIYNAASFTYEQASAEICKFKSLNKFDAIICGNDLMATAVLNFLQDKGVSVPGKVSIVGIDNDNFCNYLNPKLSSIDLNVPKMGQAATEFLIERVNKPNKPISKHVCKSEFICRQTA
jgi:LacI family transcriptional regulator